VRSRASLSPVAPRRSDAPRRSGEETRAAILSAAERHFADRGFEAARLEDIASDVGIRRAAIFYHFKDKSDLYAAVLQDVLGDIAPALPDEGTAIERLEASISTWIDYMARRSSVARLILREAASAQPGRSSPLNRAGGSLARWMRELIEQGMASGEFEPIVDPHRFATWMGGAMIFQFAAMASLSSGTPLDGSNPAELERHKREMLRLVRRMLGVAARRA
jgi:TetR/AcrR family transcriptional regulator